MSIEIEDISGRVKKQMILLDVQRETVDIPRCTVIERMVLLEVRQYCLK